MENEERPVWIVKYLDPDIMISHQEHISTFADYLWVSRRLKAQNPQAKVMVINYWDEKLLNEEPMRDKFGRSTTNTIKQIFSLYSNNPKYAHSWR